MNKKNILLMLLVINSCMIGMEPIWDTESSDDETRLEALGRKYIEAEFNKMMASHLAKEEEEYKRIELNEELIGAVISNDLEAARAYLEAGASANYNREDNTGPLSCAIEEGHIEMCELLINAGADVNCMPYENGPTALYYAKNKKMGEFLLQHGTDIRINATENRGSALQSATMSGSGSSCAELCELYIKAGADLLFVNKWGVGPLKSAVIGSDMATAELLGKKMLTIPSEEQKERIYAFLGCLKRIAADGFPLMYNKDIRRLIVRTAIKQENLPLVLEQINSYEIESDLLQRLGI